MSQSSKADVRTAVWNALEEEGIARFPFPPHGRIPNFEGARAAAERLLASSWFEGVETIKVNPDAPQRFVRIAALKHGCRVLVPTPRLRGGFYLLDPSAMPADAYRPAASLSHMEEWAETVPLDALPVLDLIVTGSVAVTRDGRRCGKGEGYSDLEYAILGALGQEAIPVVTTVHPSQVVEGFPVEEHDLTLSALALPDRVVGTGRSPQPPPALDWAILDETAREEMPVLQQLWERRDAVANR